MRGMDYPVYMSFENKATSQWHDELLKQADKIFAEKKAD
jgi:hypothetical protein